MLKRDERVSVRLPSSLRAKLVAIGERMNLNLSATINYLLNKAVKETQE